MLDFADGDRGISGGASDDFLVDDGRSVAAATKTVNRVEVGSGEDVHKICAWMLGRVGDDKINIDALFGKSASHV